MSEQNRERLRADSLTNGFAATPILQECASIGEKTTFDLLSSTHPKQKSPPETGGLLLLN
jgi:hypothetical protein